MHPGDPAASEHETRFRLLDFSFTLLTNSPAATAAAERLLCRLPRHDATVGPEYRLVDAPTNEGAAASASLAFDGLPLIRNATLPDVLEYFMWHAMREAIAAFSGVIVHAGVVARGGRAVVLPGRSGSGKSTLVAGLLRAGFAYLSDELAAFDPATGDALPVSRALTLKRGSWPVFADLEPDAVRLGQRAGDLWMIPHEAIAPATPLRAAPVRFVIAPAYHADSPLRLTAVSRAEGLIDLAQNAFNLDALGRDGFEQLGHVAGRASCFRLKAGSLDEAVGAVVDLVGNQPVEREAASMVAGA